MKRVTFPRRIQQRGMTLLEVVVALLIFSFGILGMVGLQARAVQFSFDAEDRMRAAMLANEIVSTMWAQQTLTLPAADVTAWVTRVQNTAASGLPNANGTVGAPDANGVVMVTVTWKSPAKRTADADSRYITQVAMP